MTEQTLHKRLLEDPDYALAYAEEDLIHRVALGVSRRRRTLGLSQSDLAGLVGTKQPRIAAIEGGFVNLTLRRLARLAVALECDAGRLVASDDPGQLDLFSRQDPWSIHLFGGLRILVGETVNIEVADVMQMAEAA